MLHIPGFLKFCSSRDRTSGRNYGEKMDNWKANPKDNGFWRSLYEFSEKGSVNVDGGLNTGMISQMPNVCDKSTVIINKFLIHAWIFRSGVKCENRIYADIVKRWSTRPWMTSIQVNSMFEWRKWPLKSISTYIRMHFCLPSYSMPESWYIFVK